MDEIKNSVQSTETGKAAYVKPTMDVYEMEVETAVLVGVDSAGFGGDYERNEILAPARRGTWGNLWDSEETI